MTPFSAGEQVSRTVVTVDSHELALHSMSIMRSATTSKNGISDTIGLKSAARTPVMAVTIPQYMTKKKIDARNAI
jgi:hypothetical protein